MNTTPLTTTELEVIPERLPGWSCVAVDGVVRLERTFTAPDYATAMSFTQLLGEMADGANHHPTVLVQREQVTVAWWTMSTRSLTQIDVTMAERTNRLFCTLLNGGAPIATETSREGDVAQNGGSAVRHDTQRIRSAPAAEER